MTPTRIPSLVLAALVAGVLGFALAEAAYSDLPRLPVLAAVSLVLLAVTELAMAKVVSDRLAHRRRADGRPAGKALHPMQIARAAVLAKASSPAGALLAGGYAGLLLWTYPRRDEAPSFGEDAVASGASAAAAVLLVVAALVLERACRAPDVDAAVEESTA